MTHLFFCTSLALAGWEQKRPRHRAPPLSTGTVTSVHSPSHVHSPHQYLKRRERKRICTQSHTFEHLQFLLLCQLLHNQWSGMDSIPAQAAGFFKLRCVETWASDFGSAHFSPQSSHAYWYVQQKQLCTQLPEAVMKSTGEDLHLPCCSVMLHFGNNWDHTLSPRKTHLILCLLNLHACTMPAFWGIWGTRGKYKQVLQRRILPVWLQCILYPSGGRRRWWAIHKVHLCACTYVYVLGSW